MQNNEEIQLSIIIVTHNAKDFLRNCLRSVFEKIKNLSFEVLVVDNTSSDGTFEMLKNEFPQVKVIFSKENLGFAKANNLAIKEAKGKYIFLLNPDTILLDENFEKLIDFAQKNLNVGAIGPKVLNSDFTIQHQCKRGFPTPWNTLYYFLGLAKIFPKSKVFSGYLLTYLDTEKIQEVDSLSGCAMVVKREAIEKVGMMDEDYYLYGDDLDWCYRIKSGGWKVIYFPETKIIHYGGKGGTGKKPYFNIYCFYKSALIFYRKHLAKEYFFLINWLVYFGIFLRFLVVIIINSFKKEKTIGSKKP
jgi:GT2 family glycosyltransferase